jgi:serine O-acetyltransferase
MDTIKDTANLLLQGNFTEYQWIPSPERPLPNVNRIKEIMNLLKSILFPNFFGDVEIGEYAPDAKVEANMTRLYALLNEQIYKGLCCFNERAAAHDRTAPELTTAFINKLPEIKRLLATDVKAVCDSDPAATGYGEVIFCYPAIQAMIHYRIAHELLKMQVPVLPRIMTELAHSATGIDIHPGASIGEYFSIDHGTGVVIGETCIIGHHVQLYQGVTLGAKGFTLDAAGLPVNVPRHPVIEDNVIIYANATILGRITIGHNSIIGGNIWQVHSVPPYSRIVQKKATDFNDGLGI